MLGQQPAVHASVRSLFMEALSPKSVLALSPVLEAYLERHTERWDEFARTGQVQGYSG